MKTGTIVQVSGPVIDVKFENGYLPKIREALYIVFSGKKRVMEVSQHIANNMVRCIMLAESDGLARGMLVYAPGETITVPVGEVTLGRMFNVMGDPIDGEGEIPEETERHSIYRKPPAFEEQRPVTEILETGIKVIDLWSPIPREVKSDFSAAPA